MFSRNKIAMLVAEFLGTGVLTLVIVSVQRSTIGVPYFVGLAGGLAAATLVYAFNRVSGAHLNPAVTLGMWTARRIKTVEAILFIAMQLLGGFLAGELYKYFINNDLTAVSNNFTGRILVAEAVGAAILGIGWAAATFSTAIDESRKAILVGATFALGIIAASSASVGIVNPAVALGAHAWVWGTYVLGPVLGAVIGINLYGLLFAPADARFASATVTSATASVPAVAAASAPAKTKKSPTKKKPAAKRKTTKRK